MTTNWNTAEPDLLQGVDPSPDVAPVSVMTRQEATVTLADGSTLSVVMGNPDTIRWEQTAARRWPELLPDVDDKGNMRFKAPMFMQTFVTWAALKRTRQYDGEFEQFSATDCMEITVEEIPVNPTRPERSPGSP